MPFPELQPERVYRQVIEDLARPTISHYFGLLKGELLAAPEKIFRDSAWANSSPTYSGRMPATRDAQSPIGDTAHILQGRSAPMSLSPDSPGRRPGTDLADHLSLLRRRWLLFLGLLLAGGTAGLALLRVTPPAYTATTQVLVAPVGVQEQSNQVTNRQREPLNLDTEAQIAQSSVVATKAAKELKTSTPEPVEVSVPPNSAVLWISFTAADPAVAAAQSRAYAQAYLANRTESAQATMTAQQQGDAGQAQAGQHRARHRDQGARRAGARAPPSTRSPRTGRACSTGRPTASRSSTTRSRPSPSLPARSSARPRRRPCRARPACPSTSAPGS